MDQNKKNFIDLLASAIGSFEGEFTSLEIDECLKLAQFHKLSNLLYYALPKLPEQLQPDIKQKQQLKELAFSAASRDVIQDQELQKVIRCIEKEGISVLPLKGCVIKRYYPKSAMRFMSDSDLLIRAKDAEKLGMILQKLGYTPLRMGENDTDIYLSPLGMSYEVHTSLKDEGRSPEIRSFLENLISLSCPSEDNPCLLELPFEEHYAYILCHFVKHLLYGGIGVRQVMDIYICRKNWTFDEEKLSALLKELGLDSFALTLERLAFSWFGGGQGDAVTEELGQYILESGVFGSEEHKVADRMLKEQNGSTKFSYVFTRLFPGYKTMCFYYPVLKKWSILLPAFWFWRMIYALLFRRGKLRKEISAVGETDQEALRQRAAFYQRCGLKVYTELKKGKEI